MKFSKSILLNVACTLTLAACGARSTDEEKVRALFANAEKAAEDRDTSDVLAFIASDYADSQGFDKSQLQNFLRGYFLTHPKVELVVSVDDLEFPADGLARANVAVTAVDLSDPHREHLSIELRRTDGRWLVARADRVGR
jgi:hypothetical protein